MKGWLRCERCRHRWRALRGEGRRQYVAALLDARPADLHSEDVAMFGDDCPRCGERGRLDTDRRVWR